MNAILIPAYRPDRKLLALTMRLLEDEALSVVVVDDGSGKEFADIFAALDKDVHLISYPQNKGKGGALKTGIRYIYENLPDCERLVTADADGQHTCEDIRRVLRASEQMPGSLILGSRAFDGQIPFRSRFGNFITRQIFAIASGVMVRDTQTGLRAFDRACMKTFMDVPGERYEYEINVLLFAARAEIPIREITIQTVYLNGNESSHFHPVRDSLRIYMCIFKYTCSAMLSWLIDYVTFLLLFRQLGDVIASVIARYLSAGIIFIVNHKIVFRGNEKVLPAAAKYVVLVTLILAIETLFLGLFINTLHMPEWLAKIITQFIGFLINFPLQGRVVYRKQRKNSK